jgi:hypothetical protein
VLAAVAAAITSIGCRHPINTKALPFPPPSSWNYCWWTVLRSTLPADSVAARFRRAFVTAGMTDVHWTRSADTIWLRAGPALLQPATFDSAPPGPLYWSEAAAFHSGDSTHFRFSVAIAALARGSPPTTDSSRTAVRLFKACDAIARAADIHWYKRHGDPGNEEALPVWSRVP